jgi:hypothetical protein
MFTKGFDKYVCEGDRITCEVDGFECTAIVFGDDCGDRPDERSDGFWPSKDSNDAGYVLPEHFEREYHHALCVMEAWKNNEWFYGGVAVTVKKAGVRLTGRYDAALWGIECNYPDSDNSYLMEVANELLLEALAMAKAKLVELVP